MQYCTVEYGGRGDTPAINIASSSPFIDHCTISNNAQEGVYVDHGSSRITSCIIKNNSGRYGGGISIHYGTAIINNNTIYGNSGAYGGGISIGSCTASIDNNTIYNNSAQSGGGIYMGGGRVTLTGNLVHNNLVTGSGYCGSGEICGGGGGIQVRDGEVLISDNLVCNNLARIGGGGGILVNGGVVTINNNIICNNSAAHGGGIYAGLSALTINNNTMTENSLTEVDYDWMPPMSPDKGGGISIFGQPLINYNNIWMNIPYDVYNSNSQGSPSVNVTNNWWGTSDEATIQAHIYDWHDNAILGIVDYIPYLREPITPENIRPIASFTYSPPEPIVNQTIK